MVFGAELCIEFGRFYLIVYWLEVRVELIAHACPHYSFCIRVQVGTVHVSGSMFSSPSLTLLEMHINTILFKTKVALIIICA